jgi:hypothetical protein
MSTINGLPAHVLLVHAVVVLMPLVAVLLVVQALWPAARARLVVPTGILALVVLVAVPITTEAGEWLEHRIPRSPLVETHTGLGDYVLPWAIGLAVVALAYVAREYLARRRGGTALTVALAVVALVAAVGSVAVVYRVGESGARAAWTGQFSPTPLPGRPGPPRDGD